MSLLPFKTSASKQTAVVSDSLGNEIELPKYGCVTWEEHENFSQYTLLSSRDDDLSLDVYRTEVVVIFLRSRFNIQPDVPKSEVLKLADGSPVPQPLINALWDFFKNERDRWGEQKQQGTSEKK